MITSAQKNITKQHLMSQKTTWSKTAIHHPVWVFWAEICVMHMWVVKAINTLTHLDVRRLRKLETSASICWSFHILKAKERPDERFLSWHELSLSEGEPVTLPLRSASCCHVEQECDDEGLKADAERGWAQRLTGTCQRRKMKKKKDGKLERWKAKERGLWMCFFCLFLSKKKTALDSVLDW